MRVYLGGAAALAALMATPPSGADQPPHPAPDHQPRNPEPPARPLDRVPGRQRSVRLYSFHRDVRRDVE